MVLFDLYFDLWIVLGLVKANPVIQTTQPCLPSLHHHIYRQPYSEPLVISNNIHPYPQLHLVQNPLPAYQIRVPTVKDHINTGLWEKLFLSPTVRDIIDPNTIFYDNIVKKTLVNPNPYNTGGVVNNYIIVPPEYIKINDTLPERKVKRSKNSSSKDSKKENGSCLRRKKVLDTTGFIKEAATDNVKTRKLKQNVDKKTKTSLSDSIRCYTPADVLGDEHLSNKKYKTKKVTNDSDEKLQIKKDKSKKSKNNKYKKKSLASEGTDKLQKRNKSKKKAKRKKSEQDEHIINDCNCNSNTNIPKVDEKTVEEAVATNCDKNLDELFNLNHDCLDLENRCTRNSKKDAATKDLPDDIFRSFNWYMNDLFTNQAPNSNLFSGNNMYPYDMNQVYHALQYSNAELSKPNGNKEKNKNSRRKKKPKKKNPSKKKKVESGVDKNDTTSKNRKTIGSPGHLEVTDEVDTLNTNLTSKYTTVSPAITTISAFGTIIPPEAAGIISTATTATLSAASMISTIKPATEMNTPIGHQKEPNITEISSTKQNISVEEVLELSHEPIREINENQYDDIPKISEISKIVNPKNKLNKEMKEIYETQIPETIKIDEIKRDTIVTVQNDKKMYDESSAFDEIPSTADFFNFHQISQLESEELDNIFDNRLLEDYYPDFRADNHAYLVSEEEIDFQNIHGRYFYTTDKNRGSMETDLSSTDQFNFQERAYNEDSVSDEFIVNSDNSKDRNNDDDSKVVFKTPPGLVDPDFRTRKINKERPDSMEIYYQHNDNNNDFDRFNMDSFADRSDNIYNTEISPKDKSSVVETVYARSKVVKYGQIDEPKTNPKDNNHAIIEDRKIDYDDKTIVIAKTLDPEDFW